MQVSTCTLSIVYYLLVELALSRVGEGVLRRPLVPGADNEGELDVLQAVLLIM
jgi:hypothetical protein